MASSSMPEDAHDTPTAPRNTPPGTCTQLKNLKLNHEWEIGDETLKENERHATVYSVLISETGQSAENLEAHVFALDGIEPKLRKHRQRCIKRMKGRTELEVKVDDITIVVITTSQTVNACVLEQRAEPRHKTDDGQLETDGGTTPTERVKLKTLYKRELQQTRQRRRRQAKRCAKTRRSAEKTADRGQRPTETVHPNSSIDGKIEFSMFVSLIHELLNVWDFWEGIPAMYTSLAKNIEGGCLDEVFDQYLSQTTAALQIIEEMESRLKMRRREIFSLWAIRSRVEMYNLNNLANINQEVVEQFRCVQMQKRIDQEQN